MIYCNIPPNVTFTIYYGIMIKLFLIVLGSVFLGLGFLGIFTPGLPTTPFLLLAAGCYVRSSDSLYSWLLQHKLFGKYIHNKININLTGSFRDLLTSRGSLVRIQYRPQSKYNPEWQHSGFIFLWQAM